MEYSYFRVQQEFAKLIITSLSSNLSIEECDEVERQADFWMFNAESPDRSDLWEIGWRLRRWAADADIRRRDPEYDAFLSNDLREWAEANLFSPDKE